jgi:hypothetical protein
MTIFLSDQPNKAVFGTSDFAVSPVGPPEYIDASAEETCPTESAPTPEQRAADEPAKLPPAASLEVMDQLKALAQSVTQNNRASFDESGTSSLQKNGNDDSGGAPASEPPISVLPRPTGFESNRAINDRPKSGNRLLTLTGFVLAAMIGAGSSVAWQAHLKSSEEAAKAAAPAPVAPAPVIAPYLGRQLEDLAKDISSVRHGMEELAAKQQQLSAAQKQLDQLAAKQQQLTAKQEQVGQTIAKLQAMEQARQRTPVPVQTRATSVPPRHYIPPPPVEPTAQPPSPPQTASHPTPPLPVPITR